MKVFLLIALMVLPAYGKAVSADLSASEPEQLVSQLHDLGYQAVLIADSVGDPLIRSAASGLKFEIVFFGCQNNTACKYLLFHSAIHVDSEIGGHRINEWNAKAICGRTYLDQIGGPHIDFFVTTEGGISRENFADVVDWWSVTLGDFKNFVQMVSHEDSAPELETLIRRNCSRG